jgi:hypothetical protein
MNEKIIQYATDNDLKYIDIASLVDEDDNYWQADSKHMNSIGAAIIASTVRNEILGISNEN